MSVTPVRTDPGLHYSQEVYMMETMQHNVEHKQTHTQEDSTIFTLKDITTGSTSCDCSIICKHKAASMNLYSSALSFSKNLLFNDQVPLIRYLHLKCIHPTFCITALYCAYCNSMKAKSWSIHMNCYTQA